MAKVAGLYEEEKQEAANPSEQKRTIRMAESLIKNEVDSSAWIMSQVKSNGREKSMATKFIAIWTLSA